MAVNRFHFHLTVVEKEGPLIKLWAQLDKAVVEYVDNYIIKLDEQFSKGGGKPYPSSVAVGLMCCAQYNGIFYRARVISVANISVGHVVVRFVDYGNTTITSVDNLRLVDEQFARIPPQAADFYLHGVTPLTGADVEDITIDYMRQNLCYKDFDAIMVASVNDKRLIKLYQSNVNIGELMVAQKFAHAIDSHHQEALLLGNVTSLHPSVAQPQQWHVQAHVPSAQFSHKVPSVQGSIYDVHGIPPGAGRASPLTYGVPQHAVPGAGEMTVKTFTSPILEPNSEHNIFVSNVEDGPLSFAVQLQAAEQTLIAVTADIAAHRPIPLREPPVPGSVCLARFPGDTKLSRATIMEVMDSTCRLYYVDFGNVSDVPYTDIFELPAKLINPKAMALRFCLAGLKKGPPPTNITKEAFKDVVRGCLLRLRVAPNPEGPPLKQYGYLFKDGRDVRALYEELARERSRSVASVPAAVSYLRAPSTYEPPKSDAVVDGTWVTISHLNSPDEFWVQLESDQSVLEQVMALLDEYCNQCKKMPNVLDIMIKSPIFARFSEDDRWYRASILKVESGNEGLKVEVEFVDYGNEEVITDVGRLRLAEPSIVSALAAQAIRCRLNGAASVRCKVGPEVWDQISTKFTDLTLESRGMVKLGPRGVGDPVVVIEELRDDTLSPPVVITMDALYMAVVGGASEGPPVINSAAVYSGSTSGDWQEEKVLKDYNANPSSKHGDYSGRSRSYDANRGREESGTKSWESSNNQNDGRGRRVAGRNGNQEIGNWDGDGGGSQKENDEFSPPYKGGRKGPNMLVDNWDSRGGRRHQDSHGWDGGRQSDSESGEGHYGERGGRRGRGGGYDSFGRGGGDNSGGFRGSRRGGRDGGGYGGRSPRRDDGDSGQSDGEGSSGGRGGYRGGRGGRSWGGGDGGDRGSRGGYRGGRGGGGGGWEDHDSFRKKDDDGGFGGGGGYGGYRGGRDRDGGDWDGGGHSGRGGRGGRRDGSGGRGGHENRFGSEGDDENPSSGFGGGGYRGSRGRDGGDRPRRYGNEGGDGGFGDFRGGRGGRGGGRGGSWDGGRGGSRDGGRGGSRDGGRGGSRDGGFGGSWRDNNSNDSWGKDTSQNTFSAVAESAETWEEDTVATPQTVAVPEVATATTMAAPLGQIEHQTVEVGSAEEVTVVFVESRANFFVQLKSQAEKMDTITALLTDNYEVPNMPNEEKEVAKEESAAGSDAVSSVALSSKEVALEPHINLSDLHVGMPCAALFSEDGVWYRACVESEATEDGLAVSFVDYGNKGNVTAGNVRKLPQEFCSLPAQAICCSLVGLGESEGEGDEEKDVEFEAEVTSGEATYCITFVKRSTSAENEYVEVVLRNKETEECVNSRFGGSDEISASAGSDADVNYSSQGMENIPKPEIKLGCSMDVDVVYVVSRREFYCQPRSTADQLSTLMEMLASICAVDDNSEVTKEASASSSEDILKAPLVNLSDLHVGMPCAALFSEDGVWYRAYVESEATEDGLAVSFVDYGNKGDVTAGNVRKLPQEFCSLPAQAICCSLAGLGESEGEGDEEKDVEFETEVTSGEATYCITFVKRSTCAENECVEVILRNKETKECVNSRFGGSEELPAADDSDAGHQPTTQGIENIPKPDIEIGSTMDVDVVYVLSRREFYCQPRSSADQLSTLMEKLASVCTPEGEEGVGIGETHKAQTAKATQISITSMKPGMPCAALFSEDGVWYRAVVDGEPTEEGLSVNFVDYGNKGEVAEGSLRELPGDMRLLPAQAICCCLLGVSDGGGENAEAMDVEFEIQVTSGENSYTATFVKRLSVDQNECLEVILKNKDTGETMNSLFGGSDEATETCEPSNQEYSTSYGIPKLEAVLGSTMDVEIVYVASRREFYCQPKESAEELQAIMNKLATMCTEEEEEVAPPCESTLRMFGLKPGMFCAALYSEDSVWYRAQVLGEPKVKETGSGFVINVKFIDYGNEAEVEESGIKELIPALLSFPAQAIPCSLLGIIDGFVLDTDKEILFENSVTDPEASMEALFVGQAPGSDHMEILLRYAGTEDSINQQFGAIGEVVGGNGFGLRAAMPADQSLEVSVIWFVSPFRFYVQPLEWAKDLVPYMESIQKVQKRSIFPWPPAVRTPVLARFVQDGGLYRAVVEDIGANSTVRVQYVDYGNRESLTQSQVWAADPCFKTKSPQAISCALAGISPVGNLWPLPGSPEASLDKYFALEKCTCIFHGRVADESKVVDGIEGETRVWVTLLKTDGTSVADDLVATGLATYDDTLAALLPSQSSGLINPPETHGGSNAEFGGFVSKGVGGNIELKEEVVVKDVLHSHPLEVALEADSMDRLEMDLANGDEGEEIEGKSIESGEKVNVEVGQQSMDSSKYSKLLRLEGNDAEIPVDNSIEVGTSVEEELEADSGAQETEVDSISNEHLEHERDTEESSEARENSILESGKQEAVAPVSAEIAEDTLGSTLPEVSESVGSLVEKLSEIVVEVKNEELGDPSLDVEFVVEKLGDMHMDILRQQASSGKLTGELQKDKETGPVNDEIAGAIDSVVSRPRKQEDIDEEDHLVQGFENGPESLDLVMDELLVTSSDLGEPLSLEVGIELSAAEVYSADHKDPVDDSETFEDAEDTTTSEIAKDVLKSSVDGDKDAAARVQQVVEKYYQESAKPLPIDKIQLGGDYFVPSPADCGQVVPVKVLDLCGTLGAVVEFKEGFVDEVPLDKIYECPPEMAVLPSPDASPMASLTVVGDGEASTLEDGQIISLDDSDLKSEMEKIKKDTEKNKESEKSSIDSSQ